MKINSGKASVLVLTATFAVVSILLGKSLTSPVLAWNKDGGLTCQNVFAKIQNDNHFRYSDSSDGYVKYVRTETDGDGNSTWEWQVGPVEGDVTNNAWVEVNWTPSAGFSGDVEALVAIYEDKSASSQTWDDFGDFEDYKKVTGHLNCPASTPTPTPTPEPTATPDNDICDNIDGIQGGVPEGMHLDASGLNCVNWSQSGPPVRYDEGIGQVLGASTGKVLGTSTMAKTGGFAEALNLAIMALGGTLSAYGIKGLKKVSKKA